MRAMAEDQGAISCQARLVRLVRHIGQGLRLKSRQNGTRCRETDYAEVVASVAHEAASWRSLAR